MKKSNIVKGLLITLVSLSMIMFTTNFVSAADEGYVDFDEPSTSNSSSNKANTNSNKSNTNSNKNKTNTNSNKSNTNSLNTNGVRGNNVNSYNNTSLPKTGLQESLPTVLLVVVFGISAVYAYKKINYYRNI